MVTKYGNLSESDLSSYKTFFTLFDLYFILFLFLERKKLNEWIEYRNTEPICYCGCWLEAGVFVYSEESVTSLDNKYLWLAR